jgi:hypothetical protein
MEVTSAFVGSPALLIARKIAPEVMFASEIQARSADSIQSGTGTVLT